MTIKEMDFIATIPQPLLHWIKAQRPLPLSLTKSRTFYEASRGALALQGRRELDHFVALHTWVTIALISDKRTRVYMAKLISDETEGFFWTVRFGAATRVAMEELTDIGASTSGRLFKQRRDAVIEGLRKVRESLAKIEADFYLRDLLVARDVCKFQDAIDRFANSCLKRRRAAAYRARKEAVASGASELEAGAAALFEMGKVSGDRSPRLSDILLAGETAVSEIGGRKVDRHGARSKYLREMFTCLQYTVVESRRIAFLTHASEVVFGEHMEKREVRRLVSDLMKDETEWAMELAAEKEGYEKEVGEIADDSDER